MNDKRLKKFDSMLKNIISNKLFIETMEIQEDYWIITVNNVSLASDMSYVDVYVSSIKSQDTLCKTLAKYQQVIKEEINKNITLRKTPIIRFRYDNTIEKSTYLIEKINLLDIKDENDNENN